MITKDSLTAELRELYKSSFITRTQAAEYLGVSTTTLDRERAQGVGIPYHKRGGIVKGKGIGGSAHVNYHVSDIADYVLRTRIVTA
jgi:hypothetical protein